MGNKSIYYKGERIPTGGGSSHHKEKTQAEYNNLPSEQRMNGTEYFVTDRVPLQICDYIYPIGSIYMSVNNISPAILFGGTWERIENRFLLAAGSNYNVGATGGEAEHTLTIDEMPKHSHDTGIISGNGSAAISGEDITNNYSTTAGGYILTDSRGDDKPHNNMPPYLVVNVWTRVPDPVEEEEE